VVIQFLIFDCLMNGLYISALHCGSGEYLNLRKLGHAFMYKVWVVIEIGTYEELGPVVYERISHLSYLSSRILSL